MMIGTEGGAFSVAGRTDSSRQLSRVLVIAYDRIGSRMAGPGVRSWELARAIAELDGVRVTVASEHPIERSDGRLATVQVRGDRDLRALLAEHEVVLTQGVAARRFPSLRTCDAVRIVDLYDPWVLENLELHAGLEQEQANLRLFADADIQNELADIGDFFICASERQRDYWLGMLTSRARLDRTTWREDPTLRSLIDVVPYGSPAGAPAPRPVLKGVHPSVSTTDTVFLWSGGVWEWFDPVLVLDAFAAAQREEPDMVLYFMGLAVSGLAPEMPIVARLQQRAHELGLHGTRVLFGDWVPYDERGSYLHEADAAVFATRPSAEARLAFRSRMLDHFWASLPTIATGGDVLMELVEREGAGRVVAAGDHDAWRSVMLRVRRDPAWVADMSTRAGSLAARFNWSNAAAPLQRVAADPARWRRLRQERYDARRRCAMPEQGILDAATARHLHAAYGSRGGAIGILKRTRLYPFMRQVRRSSIGLRVWGPVPGE